MLFFDKYSKDRLERNGYKTIHLLGRLYLVRNYSNEHKRFSLYKFAVMNEEKSVDKIILNDMDFHHYLYTADIEGKVTLSKAVIYAIVDTIDSLKASVEEKDEKIKVQADKIFFYEGALIDRAAEIDDLKKIHTPIEPLWKKYSGETRCPSCNTFVLLHNKHCIECGQALDWSEAE